MSETTETTGTHRAARQSDPKWFRAMLRIVEFRPVILGLWAVLGGTVATLGMRFVVVEQLRAETHARIAMDSSLRSQDSTTRHAVTSLSYRVDTLRAGNAVSIKAICLDHTRLQQEMIGVVCPPSLYRGAK